MASSNLRKFQTANPIAGGLIDRLYREVAAVAVATEATSLLDAGCGEGEALARLGDQAPERTAAVDLDRDAVALTQNRLPGVDVSRHSIEALPFEDDSFDLVLCLEVLEHVPEPGAALAELARVCSGRIVLSVPDEPWFRLGSLARGKYLRGLGDHPEHVNHWSQRSLRAMLEQEVEVISLPRSFPWAIAECRPRSPFPAGSSKPIVRSTRARSDRDRGRPRLIRTSICATRPNVSSWTPTTIRTIARKRSGRPASVAPVSFRIAR